MEPSGEQQIKELQGQVKTQNLVITNLNRKINALEVR